MGFYKPAFYVALAAFAASVAFGWLRGPLGPAHPWWAVGGGSGAAGELPGGGAGQSADEEAGRQAADELRTVRTKLASCETARWAALRKAMAPKPSARDASVPRQATAPHGSGFDQQQQALCEVALDALSEQWRRDANGLVEALEQVGTEPWVEDWLSQTLALEDEMFELGPQDRAALERGYRSLWAEQGPKIQELLQAPEVDAGALVTQVRAAWQQEDDLLESLLGADALEQYRSSELKPRTTILAILAALAGMPFDRSLAW